MSEQPQRPLSSMTTSLWATISADIRGMFARLFSRRRVIGVADANPSQITVIALDSDDQTAFDVPRLRSIGVQPGDDVITVRLWGTELAIGAIQFDPDPIEVPYTLGGSGDFIPIYGTAAADYGTTNISTEDTRITQTIRLPAGRWGCIIQGAGVYWRSVATGGILTYMHVGGLQLSQSTLAGSGKDMTNQVGIVCPITRTDTSNPIICPVPTDVIVSYGFRGNITAGTTYVTAATMSGFFYRIS